MQKLPCLSTLVGSASLDEYHRCFGVKLSKSTHYTLRTGGHLLETVEEQVHLKIQQHKIVLTLIVVHSELEDECIRRASAQVQTSNHKSIGGKKLLRDCCGL